MNVHLATDDDIHPPRTGGTQRWFGLARGLARRHAVRALCIVPNRSRAAREETVAGVTLCREKTWATSAVWRLDRMKLAPMFVVNGMHGMRAAHYGTRLGATPDVFATDLHLTGLLAHSRARLRVYAPQNVEYDRFRTSREWRDAAAWHARIAALEARAIATADLTIACSDEDAARFREVYDVAREKLEVVPNGFDETHLRAPSAAERAAARAGLSLRDDVHASVFVGADWGPNREALELLVNDVFPALASAGHVLLVAGSAGRALGARREPWLRVLGEVDDLLGVLHAADAGVNPMRSGGGSNVKVPGYLAAGLAVVSTAFGMRGYAALEPHVMLAAPEAFADALRARPRGWSARGEAAPAALAPYAWGALGERFGDICEARLGGAVREGAA